MPYKMNSNTSLENSSDPDFNEYLHEYLIQTDSSNEPILHYEGKTIWNIIFCNIYIYVYKCRHILVFIKIIQEDI